MFRTRALGFLGLMVTVGAVVCASPQEAFALPNPFKWATYTAKDKKDYDYPKWKDVGGKRELHLATGTLAFKQTPAVTKVVFKVYRHGAQGGWNATPVIQFTVTPVPTYSGAPINGWTLVGLDNNATKVQFNEGEEIKIVWEVTTTQNGVDTVTIVDVITTVQFHDW